MYIIPSEQQYGKYKNNKVINNRPPDKKSVGFSIFDALQSTQLRSNTNRYLFGGILQKLFLILQFKQLGASTFRIHEYRQRGILSLLAQSQVIALVIFKMAMRGIVLITDNEKHGSLNSPVNHEQIQTKLDIAQLLQNWHHRPIQIDNRNFIYLILSINMHSWNLFFYFFIADRKCYELI